MSETSQKNIPASQRKRRDLLTKLLFLLLLAAGIFAAEQGHQWWMSRQSPSQVGANGPSQNGDAPGQGEQSTSNPSDFLANPLAHGGMEILAADPGNFAPPQQAKRMWCFQMRSGKEAIQQAKYECPGQVAQAADHYLQLASAGGYEVLSDRPDTSHKRVIDLGKGAVKMTISFEKSLTTPDVTLIVLTAVKPK